MPVIELSTTIHAPIERCFDLARSIELHKLSTKDTDEEAIDGVTSGLIGEGESVTWRARHFGVTQTLTSKVTSLNYPQHFRDEMVRGAFRMFRHDHIFEKVGDKTIMRDRFEFESPGWLFGRIFNTLVLKSYIRDLLTKRNEVIKRVAESEEWRDILKVNSR